MRYQQVKPSGNMNKEEMVEFLAKLRREKKIAAGWKTKLVDDDAWKVEGQQPSPVKKRFDTNETQFNTVKKNQQKKSES